MGKADQVSSLFWLIFSVAVVYASYRMGLGSLNKPGPGFLPFWAGVILFGLAVLVFIQNKFIQQTKEKIPLTELWSGMRWRKPIYILIALFAYELTFTYFGFILTTMVLLIFLFRGIEPTKWVWAITGAVLASVASFVLFGVWLQVQLPRGFLESLFF